MSPIFVPNYCIFARNQHDQFFIYLNFSTLISHPRPLFAFLEGISNAWPPLSERDKYPILSDISVESKEAGGTFHLRGRCLWSEEWWMGGLSLLQLLSIFEYTSFNLWFPTIFNGWWRDDWWDLDSKIHHVFSNCLNETW